MRKRAQEWTITASGESRYLYGSDHGDETSSSIRHDEQKPTGEGQTTAPRRRQLSQRDTMSHGERSNMEQERNQQVDMWAIVELMGHGRTAGTIRTSDLGGLLRVDVPIEDGFRTEYYGAQAIYSIKVVSEEIARAYAKPDRDIYSYDEPIVPRAQYEEALRTARRQNDEAMHQIEALKHGLVAVNALPQPTANQEQTVIYGPNGEESLPL